MNQDSPVDCRPFNQVEAVLRYAQTKRELIAVLPTALSNEHYPASQTLGKQCRRRSAQSTVLWSLTPISRLRTRVWPRSRSRNDFAGAQRSLEHSCMLGPGDAGHRQFALLLTALGPIEEARHHLEKRK